MPAARPVTVSSAGALLLSSVTVPRPGPESVNSGARSVIELESIVRPDGFVGAAKSTSIQFLPFSTLMSIDPPTPGSTSRAVAPVTVNVSVVATFGAPVVVLPLVGVTSAFLKTPPAIVTVTVPRCHVVVPRS